MLYVNGKLSSRLTVAVDLLDREVQEIALADPRIAEHLKGRPIRKVVVVPNKLINIVAG